MANPFPITPEMVKEAFDKTGLRPIQNDFYSAPHDYRGECACGIGAILAANMGIEQLKRLQDFHIKTYDQSDTFRKLTRIFKAPAKSLQSFSSGFDGAGEEYATDLDAYAIGRKSAQLVGLIPADA